MAKRTDYEVLRAGRGLVRGLESAFDQACENAGVPIEAIRRLVTPSASRTWEKIAERILEDWKSEQPKPSEQPRGGHPFQDFVGNIPTEIPPDPFFLPLLDADVSEQHKETIAKYRAIAAEHGVPVTTPVCYRVRAGFTLKEHAPKAGPCYQNFRHLQEWNFEDKPTEDCLVFWVPRILIGSTSRTVLQQKNLLAYLRAKYELPAHHMSGFGNIGLVAGLILAHFKATQERIPLNQYWVRTDIFHAHGNRLNLGYFADAGLHCNAWDFDADAGGNLGVFALGVEPGH